MVVLKKGVRVRGITPEILLAVLIADCVYAEHHEHLTITSITDGDHMTNSLHHIGEAIDLRLPEDQDNLDSIVGALKKDLGAAYDVVLERTHIHVEHDPK